MPCLSCAPSGVACKFCPEIRRSLRTFRLLQDACDAYGGPRASCICCGGTDELVPTPWPGTTSAAAFYRYLRLKHYPSGYELRCIGCLGGDLDCDHAIPMDDAPTFGGR